MKSFNRVVPIVTPTSSLHTLTEFLLFSFQEEDRRLVEDILAQREQGLKDELHKLEQERDTLENHSRMELELLRQTHVKELKRERDLCKSKLSWAEMEREKMEEKLRSLKGFEEELQKIKEERDTMENSLRMELELLRGDYEKELKCERGLCEEKVCCAEREKEKLRVEFDERVEVLEGINRDFEKRIEVRNQKLKILEEGMVKREKELKDEIVKREKLKRERDLFETKFYWVEKEKWKVVGRLRQELGGRIEELEAENRELRKKIELSNETLGKQFTMMEERFAKLKLVLGCGNAEIDRGSGNDVHGRVVSITDSHHKASNLESLPTESWATPVDPSFKTPQVEGRGSQGISIGVQSEVKAESSFLDYEAEDGGCSENNINCKRKRSINETEDDKDSTPFNKKIERRVESGCKKMSLPIDLLRKVDSVAHGVSKANSPPKFSSTCIKQCKYENARHENSEHHFTKSFSGVVDDTNRCSRGNPHIASPANKAVVGFRSDKEIRWKHPVDMLSAFGNDPELCMAAVCALYRQMCFSSIDIVRGPAIAKYLINNDPANKLSRSLLEVQQNRPSIIRSCQTLASQYGKQLFQIYQKELDPFFCPKSRIPVSK